MRTHPDICVYKLRDKKDVYTQKNIRIRMLSSTALLPRNCPKDVGKNLLKNHWYVQAKSIHIKSDRA